MNKVLELVINKLVEDQVCECDIMSKEIKKIKYNSNIKRYYANKSMKLVEK